MLLNHDKRRRVVLVAGATAALVLGVCAVTGVFAAGSTPSFLDRCVSLHPTDGGAKEAFVRSECEERAQARGDLAHAQLMQAKEKLVRPSRAPEAATRVVGLERPAQQPVERGHTFRATSAWSGRVGDRWYEVYAGVRTDPVTLDAFGPELIAYEEPEDLEADESNRFIGSYVPPDSGSGPLEITAANGAVLTLRTSSGESLALDVTAGLFH